MPRVAVLLEAPRPAFAPAALVEAVGPRHAVRLRRIVARRTLAALAAAGATPVIWFTPAEAVGEMRRWLGPDADLRPRDGTSPIPLVAELAAGGPWLVVRPAGAGLTPELVAAAGRALRDGLPVFGATQRQDLWLLGGPPSFAVTAAELPWDEPGLAVVLRDRLARAGTAARELPVQLDVLTADDARRVGLLT